ncbi:ABC transporter permease subunit [Nonomuraea rhodomycinica]|uniref:ABC transporter permease n=1 Tax=Nonomuraea rhodomycinica TaxID=1712872 RepID=A0A7Y6MB27_9ACTN|nr:ABC transporter permease subunit [Nonomuraea rhodomycinica]NUW40475.1 ABC transporter permease [Nonomuraea rhodomycinica]
MNMLSSEWLKIRSVRSTGLLLLLSLGAILLGLAIAWMAAGMYDNATPAKRATASIAELEEVVIIVPQLCMGILGVLAITSEYATGMIRTSLTVAPTRWPVLAAKAAVVGALGLLTGSVTVFGTYALTRQVIGDRFSGVYLTPFLDRLPTLAATGLTVCVFALLGLGLGALTRSTAGAVAVLVGLAYVIPMVVGKLPAPWKEWLGSMMISALPREISGVPFKSSVYGASLPPAAAIAVLAAYALVPVLAGTWFLRHRDT